MKIDFYGFFFLYIVPELYAHYLNIYFIYYQFTSYVETIHQYHTEILRLELYLFTYYLLVHFWRFLGYRLNQILFGIITELRWKHFF